MEAFFRRIQKPSLVFDFIPDRQLKKKISSHVGGTPYIELDENDPVCPDCNQSMMFLLQLHDPSKKNDRLTVYYACFPCKNHRVLSYNDPQPDKRKWGKTKNGVPYSEIEFEFGLSLPTWDLACILEEDLTKKWMEQWGGEGAWVRYDDIQEKMLINFPPSYLSFYGGYPWWLQARKNPVCKTCLKSMELLIQCDSVDELDLLWDDGGCLYIFCCPEQHDHEILVQKH
jgi:uncharacterized protein YwqG